MTDETAAQNRDASQDGDTSGGEGSTSTETITQAQMDEAVRKATSDALAKAGRDAKTLAEREARLKEQEAKYQDWERKQQESEDEKYREDPDGLRLLKERRALKAEREEIERLRKEHESEKAAHAELLTKAEETELELTVWRTATEKGVDAEKLKEKAVKFGLKTPEQITELAETMAYATAQQKPPLHFDSGKGTGGGTPIASLSPKERVKVSDQQLRKT
jgi:hypothetical protein